jgi:hypothetical protein
LFYVRGIGASLMRGVSRQFGVIAVSRDIFVQDLPARILSVEDIPEDFVPRALEVTRSEVMSAIRAVAPKADLSDPSWIALQSPGKYHIEVNLGPNEQLESFAFHMRGGWEAEQLIKRILDSLNLRALDSESDSGLFSANDVPAG